MNRKTICTSTWVFCLPLLITCCGCPAASPLLPEQRQVPSRWISVKATSESDDAQGLERGDVAAITSTVPTINTIVTERVGAGTAARGRTETRVRIAGTSDQYFQLLREATQAAVARGRFLTAKDVLTSAHVIVLDVPLAEKLFPGEQAVGQEIMIGTQSFSVVGVVRSARDSHLDDVPRDAYIPITTFNADQLQLEEPSPAELDRIWVEVDSLDRVEATREIIGNLVRKRHPNTEFSIR
jgi:hypothetical protein